jgi:ABC-type glycerol-3-phosphate transport system substrate-binding protein
MFSSNVRTGLKPSRPLCAILCVIVISLTGCTQATPTPEPVTIRFVHPEVDRERYEELAREFNQKHSYITVELEPREWNRLDDVDGGDVDVFVTEPFSLIELQEQGSVLNLDPFIERDKALILSDFYPGTAELLTIEGRSWAIPGGLDVMVMFYNKDLFDQHNVPYPDAGWTWNDFLNAAVATSDPDAGVYGYVTTGSINSLQYFDAALFVYQHGGRLVDDLDTPTRATFDDPLTVEAVEWYGELYHEYDVAPTPQEARRAFGGSQYALFNGLRNGNVGMWIGWLSDRGGLTWGVEWLVNWGMVALPQDEQPITQADVEGYAIYSQTESPDACWEWIIFLTQEAGYRLMPARRSLAESAEYEQFVGENVATAAQTSIENAVMISPQLGAFGEVLTLFTQGVNMVIEEEATAQEAMDWAQQQAER